MIWTRENKLHYRVCHKQESASLTKPLGELKKTWFVGWLWGQPRNINAPPQLGTNVKVYYGEREGNWNANQNRDQIHLPWKFINEGGNSLKNRSERGN